MTLVNIINKFCTTSEAIRTSWVRDSTKGTVSPCLYLFQQPKRVILNGVNDFWGGAGTHLISVRATGFPDAIWDEVSLQPGVLQEVRRCKPCKCPAPVNPDPIRG